MKWRINPISTRPSPPSKSYNSYSCNFNMWFAPPSPTISPLALIKPTSSHPPWVNMQIHQRTLVVHILWSPCPLSMYILHMPYYLWHLTYDTLHHSALHKTHHSVLHSTVRHRTWDQLSWGYRLKEKFILRTLVYSWLENTENMHIFLLQ